jgi:type III secretion protein S
VNTTITLFRDSLVLIAMLSAPALIVTTVLGILVSLVQGLFQIQDQALSYTVKFVAMVVVLLVTGGWMQSEMLSLTNQMFQHLGRVR